MEHPIEMIIGIVVFGFILLLALIGSSSDRDERRYSRGGYRRGRGGYGRYPEEHWENRYGRYEDDYWEDDYDSRGDYYRRGRGRRRRRGLGISGLIVSFFLGIIVFIALIRGNDMVFNEEKAAETKPIQKIDDGPDSDDIPPFQTHKQGPNPVNVSEPGTKEFSLTQMSNRPDPVPASAAPEWEYLDSERQPFFIRLALTNDSQKALKLKEVYAHRNVEVFQDDHDRYWVIIFIRNSQEMAETVAILQLRQEDLINHGCNIVELRTSNLCTGLLKRIKDTDFWFCAE